MFNVDLFQSNKYPLSFYPLKATILEAVGVLQAEFHMQKQIFSIMLWRVLFISKLAGNRGLKLFQTVVGSKLLSVLITLFIWCSSLSQQSMHCSLSITKYQITVCSFLGFWVYLIYIILKFDDLIVWRFSQL